MIGKERKQSPKVEEHGQEFPELVKDLSLQRSHFSLFEPRNFHELGRRLELFMTITHFD